MHENLSKFLACVRRKLTLDTFFKNHFSAAPFLSFWRLEWTRAWKDTTDILEQQLFIRPIIRLQIIKIKLYLYFSSKCKAIYYVNISIAVKYSQIFVRNFRLTALQLTIANSYALILAVEVVCAHFFVKLTPTIK